MATYKALPIKTSKEAADEARQAILEGMDPNEMQGLLCRWSKVNRAALGSWRFGFTYVVGGLSGSAKSYFVNMLRKDFQNKKLNPQFNKPFRILHISFEMKAHNELLREVSSHVNTSYADLLSAYKAETGETLSSEKYKEIDAYLRTIEDADVDYVEVTGNVGQIEKTIYDYQAKYKDHLLVITLDHTLLTDFENEKDEVSLVVKLSGMFLRVRNNIGSMNIIIAQMNGEIEKNERIAKKEMHYPMASDLYGSKAIRRDADFIFILHVPYKLGIPRYGNKEFADGKIGYPTKTPKGKLIFFFHNVKARYSDVALVRFADDLANGNLLQMEKS